MFYVMLYLGAIVVANLLVARFGPTSIFIVGFLFIGLDLTTRDKLHEFWHRNGLLWKMGLLIGTGSILTWLLNKNAGVIATASFVAFACAAITDTVIYQILYKKSSLVKINGSNVVSAAIDSMVFPTIAFGGFSPLLTLGQFAAKVGGGLLWSLVLRRK